MDISNIKNIIEAALLAAAKPLNVNQLESVFDIPDQPRPSRDDLRKALDELKQDYEGRGIELVEVASGYRIQVPQIYEPWMRRLWQEKPPRYSRALLETLAIITYRQPITRAEIEEIRGVAVSTNITRTLQERNWVRVVGHREVPGKPAMFGTTKEFLDYFNLKSLDQMPTLAELKDLDSIHPELPLEGEESSPDVAAAAPTDFDESDLAEMAETADAPEVEDLDNVVSLEQVQAEKTEQVH